MIIERSTTPVPSSRPASPRPDASSSSQPKPEPKSAFAGKHRGKEIDVRKDTGFQFAGKLPPPKGNKFLQAVGLQKKADLPETIKVPKNMSVFSGRNANPPGQFLPGDHTRKVTPLSQPEPMTKAPNYGERVPPEFHHFTTLEYYAKNHPDDFPRTQPPFLPKGPPRAATPEEAQAIAQFNAHVMKEDPTGAMRAKGEFGGTMHRHGNPEDNTYHYQEGKSISAAIVPKDKVRFSIHTHPSDPNLPPGSPKRGEYKDQFTNADISKFPSMHDYLFASKLTSLTRFEIAQDVKPKPPTNILIAEDKTFVTSAGKVDFQELILPPPAKKPEASSSKT